MSSKHFINDPTTLVNSSLHSLTLTNPNVALDAKNKIIYLRPSPSPSSSSSSPPAKNTQQVCLISGGGSGHEPSFSSLVGPGLLSASVAGTIFASPSSSQVQAAITARTPAEQDVLVLVMNYTGDVLNFGLAVEKARALSTTTTTTTATTGGTKAREIDIKVVSDDVGVGRAKSGKVGRRGIAGTVLVIKIAGALAARGFNLRAVSKMAALAAENIVSVGASLSHVHVPGREVGCAEEEEEEMGRGQVELGMGIHNEDGSARVELKELSLLVAEMLRQLLVDQDQDRAFIPDLGKKKNELVLLVNNLGGVSVLEMGGIVDQVVAQLDGTYGIRPVRILAGTYMTSLNGLGFSISLLNVVDAEIGTGAPGMVELLDDAAEATGWSAPIRRETWERKNTATYEEKEMGKQEKVSGNLRQDATLLAARLTNGLLRVIEVEPEVTRYDTVVGDGDCGIGLKRGAEAILAHLKKSPMTGDIISDIASIVLVVEGSMDGTSGALYTIFLNSLVHSLRQIPAAAAAAAADTNADAKTWATALSWSFKALGKYTPAQPGDRTLVDALHPFIDVLGTTGDLNKAAEAATKGADGTKGMEASLGRTVYVGGEGFEQVPDPGAYGLAAFFSGMAG